VFELAHCSQCEYTFVVEPRDDFAALYDAGYYSGRGADPLTDYAGELANERTVRLYEWQGLLQIVDRLVGLNSDTRWLDHGCGLGGAVRYARHEGIRGAYGFDEGYAREVMRRDGVPFIARDEIARYAATFDIVTSIDVLEHASDPVALLREILSLLKPKGVLFLTTGNAEPFRRRMLTWAYAGLPDVHVGFFEPRTVRTAYRAAGLTPMEGQYLPGFSGMLRYKILKNLRIRERSWRERALPWPALCRIADWRYRLSAIPLARRDG
jgi:SAM-dependent methyltransferase